MSYLSPKNSHEEEFGIKKTSSKKSKKRTRKTKEANSKFIQPELDFSSKYVIQWHSINEDPNLKNKKGYKTRTKFVKDIVNDEKLFFNSLKQAEEYISTNLICEILYHEMSQITKGGNLSFIDCEGITSSHDSGLAKINETTFTYRNAHSFAKYWIEIKQV